VYVVVVVVVLSIAPFPFAAFVICVPVPKALYEYLSVMYFVVGVLGVKEA
jgi:hypothetical protein